MNFSVHFGRETVERLALAVERTQLTRNRIIVDAVKQWLELHEAQSWPEDLNVHWLNPAPEPDEQTVEFEPWRPEQRPNQWNARGL